MEFQQHQLENGLTVIAECNERAYATALGYFVNTGSRDETSEIGGVSHFLEHMAFKGTPKRSAEDVNRELDEMGSSSNARTSEQSTIYHATVLPEFQDRTVELLSDIMRPALRDDDFESEKKVIIEEIMMYDDQPPFGGHEKIMADYFGNHPMGHSVLGTAETVGQLTPEKMHAYFRARYSPGNMTLVAAGNVDFDALVASARQHCGHWERSETTRSALPVEPNFGFQSMVKESAAQQYILQLSQAPDSDDDTRFASRMLSSILGDDCGSRMFWEFIDTGIAEYAGMGAYEYEQCGVMFTVLCCAPEDAQQNLERLYKLQAKAEAEGITERELTLAKKKAASNIILASERSESRMFAVGSNWLARKNYRSVDEVLARYDAIKVDDVNAILSRFPLTRANTLVVGPATDLRAVN